MMAMLSSVIGADGDPAAILQLLTTWIKQAAPGAASVSVAIPANLLGHPNAKAVEAARPTQDTAGGATPATAPDAQNPTASTAPVNAAATPQAEGAALRGVMTPQERSRRDSLGAQRAAELAEQRRSAKISNPGDTPESSSSQQEYGAELAAARDAGRAQEAEFQAAGAGASTSLGTTVVTDAQKAARRRRKDSSDAAKAAHFAESANAGKVTSGRSGAKGPA